MNSVSKSLLVLSLALVGLCTAIRVPADPVDIFEDAGKIREAIIQSKEDVIAHLLTRRNRNQRLEIAQNYTDRYERNLAQDLASTLSGNLKHLMVALVIPLADFHAKEIHRHQAVIDITFTATNAEIKDIAEALQRYKISPVLPDDFVGLTDNMAIGAFTFRRDESQDSDVDRAISDAIVIREIGEMWYDRTDEEALRFENIFIERSYAQLYETFRVYKWLYGHDIEEAFVLQEFSSKLVAALNNLCSITRSRPDHFAERLFYALDSPIVKTDQLTHIIVSRSEIDLEDIKVAFQKKYEKSLRSTIRKENPDLYGRALWQIVGPDYEFVNL